MDGKIYISVLDRILKASQKHYKNDKGEKYLKKTLTEKQMGYIKTLVDNAETQKSLIAVVMTSLLKKIVNPAQDVRLHRGEFESGYSGRTLDTSVVTPWLKNHFLKVCPQRKRLADKVYRTAAPFYYRLSG